MTSNKLARPVLSMYKFYYNVLYIENCTGREALSCNKNTSQPAKLCLVILESHAV